MIDSRLSRDPSHAAVNLVLWLPLATLTALSMMAFQLAGFSIAGGALPPAAGSLIVGVLCTRFIAMRPGTYRLGMLIGPLFQGVTLGSAALMLTYATARLAMPLADPMMVRIDHAVGYDWRSYVSWFSAHPHFAALANICYNSNILQPALLILLLVLTGREARLNKFVMLNLLTLLVADAVFAFFPVTTAWVYEHLSPAAIGRFGYIGGSDGGWQHELLRIRSGELRIVPPTFAEGLVGFPSFHTISALLNIWAIWPMKRWRMLIVPANLLMIASTPVFGGHYAADVIAGILVTGLAILAVERCYPWVVRWSAAPGMRRVELLAAG